VADIVSNRHSSPTIMETQCLQGLQLSPGTVRVELPEPVNGLAFTDLIRMQLGEKRSCYIVRHSLSSTNRPIQGSSPIEDSSTMRTASLYKHLARCRTMGIECGAVWTPKLLTPTNHTGVYQGGVYRRLNRRIKLGQVEHSNRHNKG
jgi:hypothetical protein